MCEGREQHQFSPSTVIIACFRLPGMFMDKGLITGDRMPASRPRFPAPTPRMVTIINQKRMLSIYMQMMLGPKVKFAEQQRRLPLFCSFAKMLRVTKTTGN